MRPWSLLIRSGRALAALVLLVTLVTGEWADARHHMADSGCGEHHGTTPSPVRDDCTCTGLHVTTVSEAAPAVAAPDVASRDRVEPVVERATTRVVGRSSAPRAPPQA